MMNTDGYTVGVQPKAKAQPPISVTRRTDFTLH